MDEDKAKGIYAKLHAIMSEANYIQKDKANPHFGYKYASEAAIKECLHVLLVKHRVVLGVSTSEHEVVEYKKNDKGASQYRTTLAMQYRFIDIDDGSEHSGVMHGSGVDGEDKGTYKAITGALKYCLTGTFLIPTGDDPEGENGEPPPKKQPANRDRKSTRVGEFPVEPIPVPRATDIKYISEPQRKRFRAIQTNAGWTDEQAKTLLAHNGITSSKLIPDSPIYGTICGTIENMQFDEYLDSRNNPPA